MIAETIAIGTELLSPFRQDTNSLFLTERLNALGVEVAFKTVVGDRKEHLVDAVRHGLGRADILVLIGGLGPTEDDLTREAVAEAMQLPLRRDPDLVAKLYAWFASRRLKMPKTNEKQADVIAGATVLPNPRGTAPGQYLEGRFEDRLRIVMLLPGPPAELRPMFLEQCEERLRATLPVARIATRVLKVAMMGESQVDSQIAPIYKKHRDVETTILAHPGEVQIHMKATAATQEAAGALVDGLLEEIVEELDDHIFSLRGESLEQIVGYYLQMRGATLAVAESCTGGMLAARITSIAGSSRYFLGGAVTYANELKTMFANVPPSLISEHGAVSKEVAAAMADGIRGETDATLGVGITGIAGPGGGTEEKPVGLVSIAVTDGTKMDVVEKKFPGDRNRIRHLATQQALDMVRRKLMQ
jgi:nicotinamide-nucleotide amidase